MKHHLLITFLLLITLGSFAQRENVKVRKQKRTMKNAKIEACVDSLIQSRNFTVIAQSVQPMGWQTIQLSSLYDLQIKVDTVETNLPYYGRAYTVDYASTEGGIKLNAKMIDYKQVRKRNNLEIAFETRTVTDLYQFRVTITPLGYATIFVNSNNRQGIGFNGVLQGVR